MKNIPNIDFKDVTIVVNTCDLYHDVWPLFFAALGEFWPNCPCNLVLNTEQRTLEGVDVHNFSAINGNDSWGLRLRTTLESIKTKYVLTLFDDFILEAPISQDELRKIILMMEHDENIAVTYLTAMGLKVKETLNEHANFDLLEDRIDFRLNSAPAIWRREDLIRYTGPYDNPWAWEVFGSYRTYGDRKKFYTPRSSENEVFKYNHKKGGAIYRGKWVRDVVVDKDKKYNLNTDFTQRGFSIEGGHEKRSFAWKINFILLGFKMVGIKGFLFVYRSIKAKLNA